MRCATCSSQWQAGPLAAEAEPEPEPEPPLPPAPIQPPPQAAESAIAAAMAYLPRARAEITGGAAEAAAPPAPVYTPPAAPLPPAPRPARPEVDLADARSQTERESFAALLESSRQSNAGDYLSKKRRQKAGPSPWLISILLLLLLAALAWLERTPIMHAWPPSARLFNAVAGLVHK